MSPDDRVEAFLADLKTLLEKHELQNNVTVGQSLWRSYKQGWCQIVSTYNGRIELSCQPIEVLPTGTVTLTFKASE